MTQSYQQRLARGKGWKGGRCVVDDLIESVLGGYQIQALGPGAMGG